MEQLCSDGTPVDIQAFDCVSHIFLSQLSNFQITPQKAHDILIQFSQRSDLFLYIRGILSSPASPESKFLFLDMIPKYISENWLNIPEDYRLGIRSFLFYYLTQHLPQNYDQRFIIQVSKSLTEILKYDYPNAWANFFDEFYNASGFSSISALCCIQFLDYFTRDVIIEANNMLSTKASEIMLSMEKELNRLLSFFNHIFQAPNDLELIKATLNVISVFVKWVNPKDIIESNLLDNICSCINNSNELIIPTLEVFTEFASTFHRISDFEHYILRLFSMIINGFSHLSDEEILSLPTKNLISFLSAIETCVYSYSTLFYNQNVFQQLTVALKICINIMTILNEPLLFEQCCSIWLNVFHNSLIVESQQGLLEPTYPTLRRILILKMPKPYQIISTFDEFNQETKEYQTTIQNDSLLSAARDCLIFLCSVDTIDTIQSIFEQFDNLQNLSCEQINSVCWSIGIISSTVPTEIQNDAYPKIIRQLFSICDQITDKNVCSQIACGVVYVCSMQHMFLNRFFNLLKVIIGTLLKFILEGSIELKYVSINGLKTITQRCKSKFTALQEGEQKTLLEIMIEYLPNFINNLTENEITEIIKCYSLLVRTFSDEISRTNYLNQILSYFHPILSSILPFDPNNKNSILALIMILKCHSIIVLSLPTTYLTYFRQFTPDLIKTFLIISQTLPNVIDNKEQFLSLKAAKSTIIYLIFRFVYCCFKQEIIIDFIIPNYMDLIFNDYISNNELTRVQMSLKFFIALLNRCSMFFSDKILEIFLQLFNVTLPMISNNQNDNIELRNTFYSLIHCVIHLYPKNLITLDRNNMDVLIETIKWGILSPQRNLTDLCITSLTDLLKYFHNEMKDEFDSFFECYANSLLIFIFNVLVDLRFKFALQQISCFIITIFSFNYFRNKPEIAYDIICQLFTSLQPMEATLFIQALLSSQNQIEIKNTLSDFLVLIKKNIPYDPEQYNLEKEEMRKEVRKAFEQIPGFVEPNENIEKEIGDEKTLIAEGLSNTIASMSIRLT